MVSNTLATRCLIKTLSKEDVAQIVASFAEIAWDKPAAIYNRYLQEQESGARTVWVAFDGTGIASQ